MFFQDSRFGSESLAQALACPLCTIRLSHALSPFAVRCGRHREVACAPLFLGITEHRHCQSWKILANPPPAFQRRADQVVRELYKTTSHLWAFLTRVYPDFASRVAKLPKTSTPASMVTTLRGLMTEMRKVRKRGSWQKELHSTMAVLLS